MSETLNFGPQWLRNLSSGTSSSSGSALTSPPPSPGVGGPAMASSSSATGPPTTSSSSGPTPMTQFKLAEHRYGREEMLALYRRSERMPAGLEEASSIAKKEPLTPMALLPLNEEEQRCLSQCVNSTVVLRLTGRGGGGPAIRGGRGTGRGRGRGRGEFQRNVSMYDEESSGFPRGREFNRTMSWDESQDHRFDKRLDSRNFDDAAGGPLSPRKHIERGGSSSDNWRLPRERSTRGDEEDEGGTWRQAGSRSMRLSREGDDNWRSATGLSRTSWNHPREREEQGRGLERGMRERRYSGRSRQDSWHEDGMEEMPEWTMDDPFDGDIGTFDSSGAFCSTKKADKDAGSGDSSNKEEGKEQQKASADGNDKQESSDSKETDNSPEASPKLNRSEKAELSAKSAETESLELSKPKKISAKEERRTMGPSPITVQLTDNVVNSGKKLTSSSSGNSIGSASAAGDGPPSTPDHAPAAVAAPQNSGNPTDKQSKKGGDGGAEPKQAGVPTVGEVMAQVAKVALEEAGKEADPRPTTEEPQASSEKTEESPKPEEEDDSLAQMEKDAESLMSKLIEEDDDKGPEEEEVTMAKPGSVSSAADNKVLPVTHEHAFRWFYKDPQGSVQGPFMSSEMADWFSAGYFTMTLLVKRGCDEDFICLGEVIKRWGRVPFMQGPEPPPMGKLQSPITSDVRPVPQPAQPQQQQVHHGLPPQLFAQHQQQPQQQQQQQPPPPPTQQQREHLQQQQQQHQVFQQLIQQQQAFIRVQASRIYQELLHRGKSLTAAQQALLRQQLISLQQQHQLLLQQMALQGDPSRSDIAAAAAVVSEQQHAMMGGGGGGASGGGRSGSGSSPVPTSKSENVMDNISIWGGPPSKKDDWDIGFWHPSMAKDAMEESRREKMKAREVARRQEEERRQKDLREQEERRRQEQEQEEEMRRQQEMELKRQEELRRQEDVRRQEEIRRLEELRQEEERRRKQQEEQLRLEQQQRKEELRRQEEAAARKVQEDVVRREATRRAQEEAERRAQEEVARRAQEEASRRVREEQERVRREEDKQKETDKQRHQDMIRQQEMQRQQQQQDALRRLQQQQQQSKLPSTAMWGQPNTSSIPTSGTPTLTQIQQMQQEQRDREEQQRQRQLQAQMLQQAQQQQQQQQSRPTGWGSANPGMKGSGPPPKSLREIQEEQARQLMERSKQQAASKPPVSMSLGTAAVWGGANTNTALNWGSDGTGVWGDPKPKPPSQPTGFWDEAVANNNAGMKSQSSANFPSLRSATQSAPMQRQQSTGSGSKSRVAKEEENVRKLFQNNTATDEFTQWCEYKLQGSAESVDIPTFISFLQDVESPYEVRDYVKMYLGETRESSDFARQFLEHRSRYKEKQRKQQEMGNIWGGGGGVVSGESSSPPSLSPRPQDWEEGEAGHHGNNGIPGAGGNQGGNGGKKKKRMQRMDRSILGFSVSPTARINMGEIETLDD
ncbi:GRB10-interacting GYF protein 2-like isoform X2 [Acanthaster planci]|uniref:GRB10-interacting GYF protein 2-like isoform X2 n=1 Tax=Acanthaster planci TaxID=133434 RepID=A0A8B7YUD9_ACAPL|nr:GRB10-interacting GYF protein 2-like isoform X2 [Acanthaster planci]